MNNAILIDIYKTLFGTSHGSEIDKKAIVLQYQENLRVSNTLPNVVEKEELELEKVEALPGTLSELAEHEPGKTPLKVRHRGYVLYFIDGRERHEIACHLKEHHLDQLEKLGIHVIR